MKKRWEIYKHIKCSLIRMLADESDASIDAIAATAKKITDPTDIDDEELFRLYFSNYTGDDKYANNPKLGQAKNGDRWRCENNPTRKEISN